MENRRESTKGGIRIRKRKRKNKKTQKNPGEKPEKEEIGMVKNDLHLLSSSNNFLKCLNKINQAVSTHAPPTALIFLSAFLLKNLAFTTTG